MKSTISAIFLLFAICGVHRQAHAQSCSATATPAAFGTYVPTSTTATSTNATITVLCSSPVQLLVSYSIALSTGHGTYAQRMLQSGSLGIAYQIYANSSYTQVWGDGTSGTTTVNNAYLVDVLTPVSKALIAYGLIPALQNAMAGTYTDTIIATINY